jgi:hypothetical protein
MVDHIGKQHMILLINKLTVSRNFLLRVSCSFENYKRVCYHEIKLQLLKLLLCDYE